MTTPKEFLKVGVTGHTFREITEKFGKNFNAIAAEDPSMANMALGFAWFREREHLPVEAAYDKAMNCTTAQIEDLFEDDKKPGAKAVTDFVSPPPTTTP